MGVWLKGITGTPPLWITAAESQAKGSFEAACEDYVKSLELPLDTCVQNFVNDRVSLSIPCIVCTCGPIAAKNKCTLYNSSWYHNTCNEVHCTICTCT